MELGIPWVCFCGPCVLVLLSTRKQAVGYRLSFIQNIPRKGVNHCFFSRRFSQKIFVQLSTKRRPGKGI